MSNKHSPLTEGYQPNKKPIKQNGYQPAKDIITGYQPIGQNNVPPPPPKSGSNAVPPKK